ncbi:MAG: hypothetical protein LBG74_02610, partial [Spirochaetaceae bacterium]|nr:hypothetical protein [Spirochaetaceae bacterium]
MATAERKSRNLSFDEVWAIVQENVQGMKELREAHRETEELFKKRQAEAAEEFKKRQAEADKRQAEAAEEFKKRQAEADKRQAEAAEEFKKRQAEADRRQAEAAIRHAELEKQLSKLGGRFGEMIECMVKPNLVSKFQELGFTFT